MANKFKSIAQPDINGVELICCEIYNCIVKFEIQDT